MYFYKIVFYDWPSRGAQTARPYLQLPLGSPPHFSLWFTLFLPLFLSSTVSNACKLVCEAMCTKCVVRKESRAVTDGFSRHCSELSLGRSTLSEHAKCLLYEGGQCWFQSGILSISQIYYIAHSLFQIFVIIDLHQLSHNYLMSKDLFLRVYPYIIIIS